MIARVNIRSDEADKNEEGEDEEDQSELGTYILPHPIIQKGWFHLHEQRFEAFHISGEHNSLVTGILITFSARF